MPYLLVFPKDLLQDYNMFKTLQREFSPLLGVLPTLLLCFTNLTGYLWHHISNFKVLLLTFKALNGLAPQYLSVLLHSYRPTRSLRSAELGWFNVHPSFPFVYSRWKVFQS